MPGIDKNSVFPNSKMAQAVRLGQSRFVMAETVASGALMTLAAETKSGVFTLDTPGQHSMHQMQTIAHVDKFHELTFDVVKSISGVTITQNGSAVYQQGASATFNNVSTENDPVSILIGEGDEVSASYTGL